MISTSRSPRQQCSFRWGTPLPRETKFPAALRSLGNLEHGLAFTERRNLNLRAQSNLRKGNEDDTVQVMQPSRSKIDAAPSTFQHHIEESPPGPPKRPASPFALVANARAVLNTGGAHSR